VPFLLSLALGVIIGTVFLTVLRLATMPNVKLATMQLKVRGRITRAGQASIGLAAVLLALVAHSGFVRYHEYTGLRGARVLVSTDDDSTLATVAANTVAHLTTADRWGLIRNPRVELGMVAATMQLERFDDAQRWATRFLRDHPGDLSVRFNLATALRSLNQSVAAEKEFRNIANMPGSDASVSSIHAQAHHALADMLIERGDMNGAVTELKLSIQSNPENAATRAALGSVLAELGQFDDAIVSLQQAVELDPTLGQAHYNLGTLLAMQNRFADAIVHYEQALSATPDDADVHNNLGFALLQLRRLDGARQHLERAIELNRNLAGAHFNLAVLLANVNEEQLAQQHLQTAARLDPRYARLLENN
jgi:tetratricopeptide (TPR) repeat protein